MPGEDLQSWSTTAATNATVDSSINWAEGQPRNSVNNSARSMMAAHAKARNLQNGVLVTTGTGNVQAFISGINYTVVPTGLRVLLKIGAALTNTGATTLSMDNITPVAIKDRSGNDLSAGRLLAGSFVELLYDGTNWILISASSISVVTQQFTASGTYTPTAGMAYCIIECVGGGGGGGGALGGASSFYSGGGGGSGSYSRKRATAADIGASQTVTIGSGGVVGPSGTAGGNGGSTSVGTLCIANGGAGGGGSSIGNANCGGGAGGIAGTGDVVAAGAPGGNGEYRAVPGATMVGCSGHGGSSYFGGGGTPTISASSFSGGNSGSNYGAGASGASTANNGSGPQGGAGSAGIVIITEFCT